MLLLFFQGFGRPHDVQVTKDNSAVFVCEIGPNRVWKFNLPEKETQKMIKGQMENIEIWRKWIFLQF